MKLSRPAQKLWDQIPVEVRVKLLNNVWCTSCGEMTGIGKVEGAANGGDLVLRGVCTKCGGEVARVIEGN